MTHHNRLAVQLPMVFLSAWLLIGCQQQDQKPDTVITPEAQPISTTSAEHFSLTLETDLLDETSGMASSRLTPHRLWLHNDSGDRPKLYAVNGQTGQLEQTVRIENAKAFDWEDIAAYDHAGEAWLLIGDIGDNHAIRRALSLYAVREPDNELNTVPTAWKLSFEYEDGPRDSEALAVDTSEQAIYLLSKRDQPPRLYRLPLQTSAETVIAKFVTEVTTIPQPTQKDVEEDPFFGQLRAWPTAMDISSDNQQMLITTYKDAYLYRRNASESWPDALARTPIIIDLPQMPQTEAGAFNREGTGVWASSEKLPTPLVFTALPTSAQ